ncbi:MAG: hypothetical protein ACQEQL_00380 [Pseudomonadota bacterium]
MGLSTFFKGSAPPPEKMVTLAYDARDDNDQPTKTWLEAVRQIDNTYDIRLMQERNRTQTFEEIADSKSYSAATAELSGFETKENAAAGQLPTEKKVMKKIKRQPNHFRKFK